MTTITFAEIDTARKAWIAAGHTVARATIDIYDVNPDDPLGEPCWRIDGGSLISTRDLTEKVPTLRTKPPAPPPSFIGTGRPGIPIPGGGRAVLVALNGIRLDGGTQPRTSIDPDVVRDYANAMTSGAQLPAVTIFNDGSNYWLADGFHRYAAARAAQHDSIWADVKQGTQRDAVLYSVGANATHGIRRSNADKRRAIERLLTDEEWRQWSDAEIARRCAVDPKSVGALRKELGATMGIPESPIRTGADGRQINTANIGRPAAAPNPSPVGINPITPAPQSTTPPVPPANPAPVIAPVNGTRSERSESASDRKEREERVMTERQRNARQVKEEAITPAAAALAGALTANEIGAWRIVHYDLFGQNCALEIPLSEIVQRIAAKLLERRLSYDTSHNLNLAKPFIASLLASYDQRAPWLDDAGYAFAEIDAHLNSLASWLDDCINRWWSAGRRKEKLEETHKLHVAIYAMPDDTQGLAERQATVSELLRRMNILTTAADQIEAANIKQDTWYKQAVRLYLSTDDEIQTILDSTATPIIRYVSAITTNAGQQRAIFAHLRRNHVRNPIG